MTGHFNSINKDYINNIMKITLTTINIGYIEQKTNINKLKIKLLICDEEITKTHMEIETMNCQGALSAIMSSGWKMISHSVINNKAQRFY